MSDPVLTLWKFATSEDAEDHERLGELQRADQYAADLITGGVLLPGEAGLVRLAEAIDHITGGKFCGCANCERAYSSALERSIAGYFVGVATGLRLARATDAGGVR